MNSEELRATETAADNCEVLRARLAKYEDADWKTKVLFDGEDLVQIPRGLIGAACSAIDKKRDAPAVLAELRRYTAGDLSRRPAGGKALAVVPDGEELAWSALKAATDQFDRRAAPHAWMSEAWAAGSKVITDHRAMIAAAPEPDDHSEDVRGMVSDWVKVSDELPPEDEEVLCFCDSGDTKYQVLASHHNSFFTDFDHELLPVTHWAPMKPAPKESGE